MENALIDLIDVLIVVAIGFGITMLALPPVYGGVGPRNKADILKGTYPGATTVRCFRRSSAAVATSREGYRLPRSGAARLLRTEFVQKLLVESTTRMSERQDDVCSARRPFPDLLTIPWARAADESAAAIASSAEKSTGPGK